MKIIIKDHDPSKGYVVKVECGTIRKRVSVPPGVSMPLRFTRSKLPNGTAKCEFCVEGGSPVAFSFVVANNAYNHSDDNVLITNITQ